MATLAEVRKEFVKISKRYDLISSGDLSTNTDNGANYFINLAQRWLDRRTKRRNRRRKHVHVLTAGDYNYTVPEFAEFSSFRMLTATGEWDMTSKQMQINAFRDTYTRPYTDWINGEPGAWAIDLDLMLPLHEGAIPLSSVGQQTTRELPAKGEEMLSNQSFSAAAGASVSSFISISTDYLGETAEGWQRVDANIKYSSGGYTVTSPGQLGLDNVFLRQHIDDMDKPPRANVYYEVTAVISGYSVGGFSITLGDVDTNDGVADVINANGTWTKILRPTTFATVPFLQLKSRIAGNSTFTIDSLSLKEAGPYPSTLITATTQTFDFDDEHGRVGIIFYPPAEEATTAEFSAFFYTPKLVDDAHRSYWTIHHEDLLALVAAKEVEKRLGSTARINFFLEAINDELRFLDEEETQWEMDGWDTMDFMGRLGK